MSYFRARARLGVAIINRHLLRQPALALLLTLMFLPGALHAQSGRARGNTGAGSTGIGRGNQPDSGDESAATGNTNGQGEVVEGDVIRVNTTLVTIPVTVKDRSGRYLPDLGKDDFRIFEDGVEQRIAYFATVDQPFTVALVIDTSNSTNFKLEDIQNAAIAFVNQLKPEDRVMVVSFDDQIRVLSEPTSDREALVRAIRRTHNGGGTRLYDAVDQVLRERLKKIEGRKAMVLFTDGVDTSSRWATYEGTLRVAEEQDALCYPVAYATEDRPGSIGTQSRIPFPNGRGGIIIGSPYPRIPVPGTGGGIPGSGGATSEEYRLAREYLLELAERSGGRFYNGDTMLGISQAFEQVAEELRRQYSIGYYPKTAGTAGQRRQIKVRVNQPNLVVTARDSYIFAQGRTDSP